jgi:hypothetical protein
VLKGLSPDVKRSKSEAYHNFKQMLAFWSFTSSLKQAEGHKVEQLLEALCYKQIVHKFKFR